MKSRRREDAAAAEELRKSQAALKQKQDELKAEELEAAKARLTRRVVGFERVSRRICSQSLTSVGATSAVATTTRRSRFA